MSLEETTQIIGEGRSGIVLKRGDIAIKVFTGGDSLTKLVNYIFCGVPNACVWNEDAVWSAYYRRSILAELVEYWFDDKLRVAISLGVEWNNDFRAYELHTEFIDGRPASLHHPYSEPREGELSDLVDNVMKPLQERLIEAGFDGSVWQAGKGNPVASNNFLLEDKIDGECQWVWIDIESGVPALFPLNPVSLFSFYIPKAIEHRHVLFDDVDIIKLRDYIEEEKERLGPERHSSLNKDLVHLARHQERWKSVRRVDRSIDYRFKKGEITETQKELYSNYPFAWYVREGARSLWRGYDKLLGDLPWRAFDKLTTIDYKEKVSKFFKFILSDDYRLELARDYVLDKIDLWEENGRFDGYVAEHFRSQLQSEPTSPYLIDFFVHASFKAFDWWVLPPVIAALYVNDMIDARESFAIGIAGGPLMRTAYTVGLMVSNAIGGGDIRVDAIRKRSLALLVGFLPIVGNLAYPAQMLYSKSVVDREIGKFMVYDFFSSIGEKIPIWGGENTRTHHWFNRLPDFIVRDRKGLEQSEDLLDTSVSLYT